MSDRIRVSGFRRPVAAQVGRSGPNSVALIRPLNLVGPAGALWIVMAVLLWGTPHMLLFWSATGVGAYRFYDDCAYAGLGGRTVHLRGMSCPLFRLLRDQGRS